MSKKLSLILFFILISPSILTAQNEEKKFLYDLKELAQIMESSTIEYKYEEYEVGEFSTPDYEVLKIPLEIREVNGDSLLRLVLNNEGSHVWLDSAETCFTNKKYDEAIPYYEQAIKMDSLCSVLYVFLSDAYYYKNDLENAEKYLLKAIALNFRDYRAHWFLGRLYDKKEDYKKAVYEISLAHILNRNNKQIKALLVEYREKNGNKWREYGLNPRYSLSQDTLDNSVTIKAHKNWLGYAFAQAVWTYEPGFAYEILGHKWEDEWIEYKKELASVFANSYSPEIEKFTPAVEDGKIEEFIQYEIISRKSPTQLYVLTIEGILNLLDYIEKYH